MDRDPGYGIYLAHSGQYIVVPVYWPVLIPPYGLEHGRLQDTWGLELKVNITLGLLNIQIGK